MRQELITQSHLIFFIQKIEKSKSVTRVKFSCGTLFLFHKFKEKGQKHEKESKKN